MIFFNPIAISYKIQQDSFALKAKSFAASLFVHATVLSSALYFSIHQPSELPKEKPILISLADYAPSETLSDHPKPLSRHAAASKNIRSKTDTAPRHLTSRERLPLTPAASPEASAPQTSPVRPGVVPSDIQAPKEPLHSAQNPIANDSPHDASPLRQTKELPKPNVSSEDINGATLGRIRAMIENSLTYPSVARKLRIEGTVVVSFILKPDGLVEKAEILTSSGSNLLDTKAIQTVLALSGDYPSLSKTAYLKIPIVFSLSKS